MVDIQLPARLSEYFISTTNLNLNCSPEFLVKPDCGCTVVYNVYLVLQPGGVLVGDAQVGLLNVALYAHQLLQQLRVLLPDVVKQLQANGEKATTHTRK